MGLTSAALKASKRPRHKNRIVCTLLVLCLALAGCGQDKTDANLSTERATALATRVEQALAQRSAQVAIVARVGRPKAELPEGISYTHTGFVVNIGTEQTPNYIAYNLYQRDEEPDVSDLVQVDLTAFFEKAKEPEAGVVIPRPEVQGNLKEIIGSQTYTRLHNPRYSVLSNPFDTQYQNCTEFLLDVIVAALYTAADTESIKAFEQGAFTPHPIKVSRFELVIGSILKADVALSDHHGQQPRTTTFTTIKEFLTKQGAVQEQFVVGLN